MKGDLAVECVGLEKTFSDFWGRPRVRALHPLGLELPRGEILGLLGPNGAGKSTTIKLLLGLLFPTRGYVRLLGGSPRDPQVRARVGYLPEETRLFRFLSPRETLDLFGRLHGLPRAERRRRAEELLRMVGLERNADRPVGEFSKGMARRIGLAVALTGDPDLVILDEPTSGLDPLGTRDIKDLVLELRRRGRTVLLSSHLLDDVEDVADRVAILYGGRLVRLGRTGDLLERRERVRLEMPAPAALDPESLRAQVESALPGLGPVEVTTPSDRLESLFRRVVAESAQGDTWGAKAGGPIAGFLLGGEKPLAAPGAAGSPDVGAREAAVSPDVGAREAAVSPDVGARLRARSSPDEVGSPDVGARSSARSSDAPRVESIAPVPVAPPAPAVPAKGAAILAGLRARAEEARAPEPEPVRPAAPLPEASPRARDVLDALTGKKKTEASSTRSGEAGAAPAPAPAPVPAAAKNVLDKLVKRGAPPA